MKTLRDIAHRLRGIRQTEQILRAMNMVAAVMRRRVLAAAQQGRPYADQMEALFQAWWAGTAAPGAHPWLAPRPVRRALWVIVSTDRGLCGAVNTALFRCVNQALREAGPAAVTLAPVGRKAAGRFPAASGPVAAVEPAGGLAEARAEPLAARWSAGYRAGRFDRVEIFYTHCQSTLRQAPARDVWLPVAPPAARPGGGPAPLVEPDSAALAEALLGRYLAYRLRRILQDARLAEHSARTVTMDQASRNAHDMIQALRTQRNTLRQVTITRELADITTGVEAMA